MRARSNDAESVNIYKYLGTVIGEALSQVPEITKIESVVIGGQIAKDFDLLYDGIVEGLGEYAAKISVVQAKYPTTAALIGAAITLYK